MTKTIKRKIVLALFYVLSWTWGFIMSFIGLCTVAIIKFYGKSKNKEYKLDKHGACYYLTVGKSGWGGLELGVFFLVSPSSDLNTKNHEHGHGLQNCLWGPLMPFVISIPSAIRYWHREYLRKFDIDKYYLLPSYDAIWFEGQATQWGTKFFNWIASE